MMEGIYIFHTSSQYIIAHQIFQNSRFCTPIHVFTRHDRFATEAVLFIEIHLKNLHKFTPLQHCKPLVINMGCLFTSEFMVDKLVELIHDFFKATGLNIDYNPDWEPAVDEIRLEGSFIYNGFAVEILGYTNAHNNTVVNVEIMNLSKTCVLSTINIAGLAIDDHIARHGCMPYNGLELCDEYLNFEGSILGMPST